MRTYLPDFRVADPDVSARVTPRHLLNHTSGIEEDFGDPGEGDDVYERMVANIADARQVHPLGHTHGYSTALGYAILARVMEVIDGGRWDDIVKDRLFDPLGPTSTTSRRELVDRDRAATGYLIRSLEEGPSSHRWITCRVPSARRATSTPQPGTCSRWRRVFLNGGTAPNGTRIVSPGIIREMTTVMSPGFPTRTCSARNGRLGLIVGDWHGQTVYAHDGSAISQSARLRILPESGIALAMLANAGPRDSFYREVFNEILTDLGAPTIPDLPAPDLAWSSIRPGTRAPTNAPAPATT